MTDPPADRDQRLLVAELDRLSSRIVGSTATGRDGATAATEPVEDTPGRLGQVSRIFRLSAFERDLLLWCAAAELDQRFTWPTLASALSTLDCGHWDALATAAPLRHWRLIELTSGAGLVDRPLRIDERILHHLVGVTCLDARLDGLVKARVQAPGRLTAGQLACAAELAGRLTDRVVIALDGAGAESRERVIQHAAATLGLLVLVIPADRLPAPGPDSAMLARLVEREVALLGGLPMIAADTDTAVGPVRGFVAELGCQVVVSGLPGIRADTRITVPSPDTAAQRELFAELTGGWGEIGPAGEELSDLDHFRLQVEDIEAIAASRPADLRLACRLRSRNGLADLAELIEPSASWDDVVLPAHCLETLRDITRHVRHRTLVYEDWGMGGSSGRGLGVTALFTGESGTGKTLAAEVLAAALGLDLYRIDLASVVSKYIGETEKNLKRVFDAAETSGAVLLFDEADAIFGRRSEVKDSHDRYANLEISYLLQRMETYRGLAILTTNLKSALDRAFLRRIRFVVTFPFPDPAARARIWQLQFTPKVPVSELDYDRLARLQLSGGHIRTIALGAAFLAASRGEPVHMTHLLTATKREYAKLEKPLTDAEIGGWQ